MHTQRRPGRGRDPTMPAEECDMLVVGAGPAGLFAARGITAATSASVLVIDAGEDIDERQKLVGGSTPAGGEALVQGLGGAGLFSDGKLCLSLGVGGDLPNILSTADGDRLLASVASILGTEEHLPSPKPGPLHRNGNTAGPLEFTSYPVLHIGTDYCAHRIADIRRSVFQKARLHTRCELVGLAFANNSRQGGTRSDGGFVATVRREGVYQEIYADAVVLSMGKVGADREAEFCRALGVSVLSQPMYVGVRIDTADYNARALFSESNDPKFKLYFEDGTKIKTHCAAEGGEILPLMYNGLPLAGGHANRGRGSGRTSFGVLWNGIRGEVDAYGVARRVMELSADLSHGKLLAHRLVDYLAGRASTAEEVLRAHPSTSFWAAGDVRDVLLPSYFPHFDAFLKGLLHYAPELLDLSTVMFAPAIEWWMGKVQTDQHLQTSAANLYVAGDGAGWSQGIVHAAATGLLVAEGITHIPMEPAVFADT